MCVNMSVVSAWSEEENFVNAYHVSSMRHPLFWYPEETPSKQRVVLRAGGGGQDGQEQVHGFDRYFDTS